MVLVREPIHLAPQGVQAVIVDRRIRGDFLASCELVETDLKQVGNLDNGVEVGGDLCALPSVVPEG